MARSPLQALLAAPVCVMALGAPALADWGASAVSLMMGASGDSGQVACEPGGQPGTIWGTGTYTSDSSICTAAVHYGWITREAGGVVEFRTVGGLNSYDGTTQNGITSQPYGSWSSSFQITGASAYSEQASGGREGVETIIWRHTPEIVGIDGAVGESFTYHCAAGAQEIAVLIGFAVYSANSSICLAGVHAGVIDFANGGEVTVTIGGQVATYTAMDLNGVQSMSLAYDGNSFTVN